MKKNHDEELLDQLRDQLRENPPMPKKRVITDINKRCEEGIPHHPKSVKLYKEIERIDFKYGGDSFGFKSGGDGDNGEHLMYLLDIYFESEEQ